MHRVACGICGESLKLGAWDPVICWLGSNWGPGSCNLCSAAGSSPGPGRFLPGTLAPGGG